MTASINVFFKASVLVDQTSYFLPYTVLHRREYYPERVKKLLVFKLSHKVVRVFADFYEDPCPKF